MNSLVTQNNKFEALMYCLFSTGFEASSSFPPVLETSSPMLQSSEAWLGDGMALQEKASDSTLQTETNVTNAGDWETNSGVPGAAFLMRLGRADEESSLDREKMKKKKKKKKKNQQSMTYLSEPGIVAERLGEAARLRLR